VPSRYAVPLSGHTRGGQIKILGRTPVVPSGYGNRYVSGHIVEGNRHLIVSAGLGTTILPLRLGTRPEIGHLTLGGQPTDRNSIAMRPSAGRGTEASKVFINSATWVLPSGQTQVPRRRTSLTVVSRMPVPV